MNTIKKTVLFFALILIQNKLGAQTSALCDSLHWAKPGTYEIVVAKDTYESLSISKSPLLEETLCQIEMMRKENEIVDYKLNQFTLIKIYPKKSLKETILQK
jgi:hypothetical protein